MGTTPSPGFLKLFNYCKLFSFVIVIAVLNGINAADTCNEGCIASTKTTANLAFAPGTTYIYDFDSVTTIYLTGSDAQETTLQLQGQAHVYAEDNCKYTLRLQKFVVFGPDMKKNKFGDEAHLSKPIRFTFGSDELSSEICADSSDTEFSLNIKRAIISLIQSADSKRTEIDVFGTCPTTFSSSKMGETLIVTKIRDLNACGHRESIANGVISGIIDESSDVKSTPLLNGDYSNEQRIKNGILISAQLNEEYRYVPFTNGEAGARAKVVSKLQLKTSQQSDAVPNVAAAHPRTILFENPNVQAISNVNNVKTALKNTIATYQNNVGPKAASQFVELIRLMRFTKKDDLLALYQQVKAGTVHENRALARKIYFDALFRTGTGASVEVNANLLKNEMNEQEQRLAYLSFNLVKSLNKEALGSINKLLDGHPPKEAYLSVGNLVNKYCTQNGCELNEIKGISEKFVNKLGNCKADNRHQEDTVVAVLKGIRNTNNLISPALDKVVHCTAEKFSTRIRVTALQTFTAAACHKKIHNSALNLLKNRNEDSEIRIEAYLALVACPSGNLANELKTILDEETVYQVGSFIVSHLASLRSSTDPYRESARQHFANIRTNQKFPIDIRKFSFNREFSYAISSMGVGASVDSNVIYSQNDFLPRSARLNLTGEIFGNSFNLFEIAGRQENLNLLLEHYFGPKGLFKSIDINELHSLLEEEKNNGRKRRSIREHVNQFAKQVNIENEAISDINFDVSLKLFGTEMYFLSLGDELSMDPKAFIAKIKESVAKVLTEAKGFDQTYESHSLFLDADLVYPTGAGFPLKLSIQGASVVRFETSGKLDFNEISKNPKNSKFNLKVVPSYNIELTGALSIDGFNVNTGLQISGSIHSSTGIEVDFTLLDDAKNVDINVKLPLKKQEIFSFDHKIVFITQERGQKTEEINLKFSSKKSEYSGCFDQLSSYIGITFCGDVSLTELGTPGTAIFPLNGGNKASVWLEVDQEYNFKAIYDNKNPKHQTLVMTFDTPGSKIPRTTSLTLEASIEPKIYTRISLISPFRKASAEAGFVNDDAEVALYVKALNDVDEYFGKVGFYKSGAEPRQEYTPIVVLQTPDKKDDNVFGYKLLGTVMIDSSSGKSRYNFNNIQLIGPDPHPFIINGWIEYDRPKISADLALSKADRKGTIIGNFAYGPKHIEFDLGVTSNFNEFANGKIAFEVDREDDHYKNNLVLVYGRDLESTTKRIEFFQEYTIEKQGQTLVLIKFSNKFRAPFVPISFKIDGEYNKNLIKYNLEAGYGKNKFNNYFDTKLNGKSFGDYELATGVSINKHNIKVNARREIENDKSNIENKLVASCGTHIELNGVVSNRLNANDAVVNLEGFIIAAEKQDPYKVNFVLLLTPNNINSNAKLTVGPTEFLTYNIKVEHSDDKFNGHIDINVKDTLVGNGEFKAVKLIGDGNLLIDIPKLNRKLKVDTTFSIAESTYDIKSELYYDYQKDDTKKIIFDTKNKITKNHFETNNKLGILSDIYEFNVQANLDGTPSEGKLTGKFQFILPNQRQISGEYQRDRNMKNVLGACTCSGKLVDTLPSKRSRSISFDSKITQGDLKAKIFDIIAKTEYVNFNGQNALVEANVKNQPNGHFKTAAISIAAKGSLLPEVLDFLISIDEYCSEHAVYRATAKYGGQFNINVNGNYYVGGRAKPTTYELSTLVNIPSTQIKMIKFQSNGKYLAPQTDDGLYEGQFKVVGSLNDKIISIDTMAKGNGKHGSGNVNIILPDVEPLSAEATYLLDHQEETSHSQGSIQVIYKDKKTVKLSGDLKLAGANDVALHLLLQSPYENIKNVEFTYKGSKSNENTHNIQALLQADDKKYGYTSAIVTSENNPSIDIILSYPEKDVKFHYELNRLGERKYKLMYSLENWGEFNYAAMWEMNLQNYDNFYIKGDVDSPKLNLNKLHVEINSKNSAAGKGVEFQASANDKNIMSGYADYTVKDDKGKVVIEGQGNMKIYDQQKAASFKFVRNVLEEARDGEKGVLFLFNGLLGPKNIVVEFKLTNKVFHYRFTTCREQNQCVNAEVKSVLKKTPHKNNFKHEILIAIDLRKIGFAYEFGLQAETERDGYSIIHNLDMHLQAQNKPRYQYKFYLQPKKSGVILTLPSRVISTESVYEIPKDLFGKYEFTISSYMDKQNKPNSKATIGFVIDLQRKNKNVISSHGELKFAHPSLRELKILGQTEFNADTQTASGKLELDIFQNANQAIVIAGKYGSGELYSLKGFNISSEFSVSSRGLGFEYGFNGHAGASLERRQVSVAGSLVSPSSDLRVGLYLLSGEDKFELIVTGFNDELIHVDGQIDTNKMNIIGKSTIRFLDSVPVVIENNIEGLASFKLSIVRGNLLKINSEFTVGKEASLLLVGNDKELFRGRIALDQANFLTSDYKINENDIKTFVKAAQQEIKSDTEKSKHEIVQRITKVQNDLIKQLENIKSSFPDFSAIKIEYQQQWEQLIEELLADKSIKQFVDFFTQYYGAIGKTINEITSALMTSTQKIIDIFVDFYKKLLTAFNEKILPALKDTFNKFENILSVLYEDSINLIAAVFEHLVRALKSFEADFAKIGKTMSETFKSFAILFGKYFEIVRKEVYDFHGFVMANIKDLPGFEYLKERFDEFFGGFIIPENVVNILREITHTLKDTLPTNELDEFVQILATYIEDKLTNKKVNDIEVLQNLYYSFTKAIGSIIDIIRSQYGDSLSGGYLNFNSLPFSLEAFKRIPYITSLKFSPFNYLRHEQSQSIQDFLYTYRPYGFNPLNFLPPFTKHAQIADGQHIFTFDGKHLTFPGTCQYILAQDFVNGNFSIVANLVDGKLKSLILLDKGDFVEVNNDATVSINGKTSEYPIHKDDIHVWRGYYSLTLMTKYGVYVQCSLNLRNCQFAVNGYYHGKMRGLLGNGNSELYDDFTLPNGKLTENFADFGNSYKVSKSCAAVPFHEHHHEKSDICASTFGWESPLSYCYYFIEPSKYREACEHAVSSETDKEDAACIIASTYASACRLEYIPINVPKTCGKCQAKYTIDEEYTVVAPHKKADIVFVVDTALGSMLSDFLQMTIVDLRRELRTRDIADAHITFIGYNAEHVYLSLYTTNGQLDYTGKVNILKIDDIPKVTKLKEAVKERLGSVVENAYDYVLKLRQDMGIAADGKAFREAMLYPFRSDASKAIVAIRSDQLNYSINPIKSFGGALTSSIAQLHGISMNLIEPVKEMSVTKDSKNLKNIVGFNSKSVLLLADAKKRGNIGSTDMRNHLKYETDLGIDLVLDSNGYVFNLNNYNQLKNPKEKKLFIGTIATALAEQISRTEVTSDCVCKLKYGLVPSEICIAKQTKLLPPLKKTGARG